mgnify:CR=1 FL=1
MGLPAKTAPPNSNALAVVPKKETRPDAETRAREKLRRAILRGAPLPEIRRRCADMVAYAFTSYAIDGAQLAPAIRELCEQIGLAVAEETGAASTGSSFEAFCADALRNSENSDQPVTVSSQLEKNDRVLPVSPPQPDDKTGIPVSVKTMDCEPVRPSFVFEQAVSAADKRALWELNGRAGWSASEVAQRCQVDPTTVRRYFKTIGLTRAKGRAKGDKSCASSLPRPKP